MKIRKIGQNQFWFFCPGCKCAHAFNNNWYYNYDADKPTVKPSLLVNAGKLNTAHPVCHSFITDGSIKFLGDCTHELAGTTVELPDITDDMNING